MWVVKAKVQIHDLLGELFDFAVKGDVHVFRRADSRNSLERGVLACTSPTPYPSPTVISTRQWSLDPHSSTSFNARTFKLSWKPRDANT